MGFEEFKDTGVQDVLMLHHEPTVDLFSSDPIPTRPSHNVLHSLIVLLILVPHSRPPHPQCALLTTSS